MEDTAITVAEHKPSLNKPIAKPSDIIEYHKEVTSLIQNALTEEKDYGKIPGCGDKPVLLKPGAERLCLAFGARPRYELVSSEIDHNIENSFTKKKKVWRNQYKGDRSYDLVEQEGKSFGAYRYIYKCFIEKDGKTLGEGEGVCSTFESKYIDRPRDSENTVCKMAQKRAFVAAVLHSFGLSDRFTQDIEEISIVDTSVVETTMPKTKQYNDDLPFDSIVETYQESNEQKIALAKIAREFNIKEPDDLRELSKAMIGKPVATIKDDIEAYISLPR